MLDTIGEGHPDSKLAFMLSGRDHGNDSRKSHFLPRLINARDDRWAGHINPQWMQGYVLYSFLLF